LPLSDPLPPPDTATGRYLRRAIIEAQLPVLEREHTIAKRELGKALIAGVLSGFALFGSALAFWRTLLGFWLGQTVFTSFWFWASAVPGVIAVLTLGISVARLVDAVRVRRELAAELRFCVSELQRL
jgi:hypothetical protein